MPAVCPFCDLDFLRATTFTLENGFCLYSRREDGAELPGSGIIVPKAHRATAFDLSAQEWAATQDLLVRVKAHLDATFAPDGYNLGWNCGLVGGQDILHAHLHVLARFADEPHAGKGIRYWLKQPENRRPS